MSSSRRLAIADFSSASGSNIRLPVIAAAFNRNLGKYL